MQIKDIYSSFTKRDIGNYFSSDDFKSRYHFEGHLGVIFKKEKIVVRVWSPVASEMYLDIYSKKGEKEFILEKSIEMNDYIGIFECEIESAYENYYYKFRGIINEVEETFVDPYAKSCSVNGEYGMFLNFEKLNSVEWENDKEREVINPKDAIIYEMNIRDFTISENSGVGNKGKFLGLTEENTYLNGFDIKTGLEHLKELGITHIHIMPVYDFQTVDEEAYDENIYNWGYDPKNYNCLEGSYSTNPYNGEIRVLEFRELIKVLHKNGFNIVLDVVYNHTYFSEESNLNLAFPMYYYRQDYEGDFSNGSGCGNELATERSMVRKYIVDSLKFYAKEYHIDGFRFDLMGLYDIETMKLIRKEMNKINPNIILYGEGWTCLDTPLRYENRCVKDNAYKLLDEKIGMFNDNIRDLIKGSNFNKEEQGFISGVIGLNYELKRQIMLEDIWASDTQQMINYESAHDNYTLWDKICLSNEGLDTNELIKLNKLSIAMIMTMQGIPFIHSGEEFLRTKRNTDGSYVENSYNSPDYINKIDWSRKAEYYEVFSYYKRLIELRKKYKCFCLGDKSEVLKKIKIIYDYDAGLAFKIDSRSSNDMFDELIVIYNANNHEIEVNIDSEATFLFTDNVEDLESKILNKVKVDRRSCIILGVEK